MSDRPPHVMESTPVGTAPGQDRDGRPHLVHVVHAPGTPVPTTLPQCPAGCTNCARHPS